MAIIEKVLDKVFSAAAKRMMVAITHQNKESSGVKIDVTSIEGGNAVAIPTTRLTDEQKFILYKQEALTGGFIDVIIDALISIEPEVKPIVDPYDKDAKPTDLSMKHARKVLDFLGNPNTAFEPFIDIRKKAFVDFLALGRATYEKNLLVDTQASVRDKTITKFERIGELYNLPTIYMRKCPKDRAGNLPLKRAYKQIDPSGEMLGKSDEYNKYFDANEVIWMPYRPISHDLYSQGPIDKLSDTILDVIMLETHNRSLVENRGTPSGILSLVGATGTDIAKVINYLQLHYKGAERAGKAMVASGDSKWTPIGYSNSDLQFMEYTKWLMQKMIIVFHLQPFILGLIESSATKASAQAQVQAFKDYCLKPILLVESAYLTEGIVKSGFGFYDVMISYNKLDRVDAITQASIDRTDVQQSILTINEIRKERGLMPVSWGDKPFSILPGATRSGRPEGDTITEPKHYDTDGHWRDYMPGLEKAYDFGLPSSVEKRIEALSGRVSELIKLCVESPK